MHARGFGRWCTVSIALAGAALGAGAQDSEDDGRVFGQIEPGQTVVEIDQGSVDSDAGWTAVRPPETARVTRAPGPAQQTEEDAEPDSTELDLIGQMITDQLNADIRAREALAKPPSVGIPIPNAADLVRRPDSAPAASVAVDRTPSSSTNPGAVPAERPIQTQESRALVPATLDQNQDGVEADEASAESTGLLGQFGNVGQVLIALGLVVALIYTLALIYRKLGAGGAGAVGFGSSRAPSGLLEVLGRYPMGGKQSLVLLKFDRRVLLLSQSRSARGGTEMTTLCELTETEDVASVLMKVRDAEGESLDRAFKSAVDRAELAAGSTDRPRPARAKPAPAAEIEVLPGHKEPFGGYGGGYVPGQRRTLRTPDGDRAELWGDSAPETDPVHDPVASLRERLEAMRAQGGERVS